MATGDFHDAFEPVAERMGERLVRVHDPLDAVPVLEARLRGDEVLLLKASRGVALERLLPLIDRTWGASHPHGEAERPREGSHHEPGVTTHPAGRVPRNSAVGGDDAVDGASAGGD